MTWMRFLVRYAGRWRNLRYHFKNAEWDDLCALELARSGRRRLPWPDLLMASWCHGASFEDYYLLRFFEKTREQRRCYLTLSLLYELERQRNRLDRAQILRDKALFSSHFSSFLGREVWDWHALQMQTPSSKPPVRVVFKNRTGVRGRDMDFPEVVFPDWSALLDYMRCRFVDPEQYLCESHVPQHPVLARLNPGTVNTLRVVTYLDGDTVRIWGTILRVGRGKGPDNWARGGMAAWVDADGVVRGPALFKDPFAEPCVRHPDTSEPIVGLCVPRFEEVHELVRRAAMHLPEVRTVGWDVAVREDGLCLIEGNDRWSYLLLQNTQGRGCRDLADSVCDMYKVYE